MCCRLAQCSGDVERCREFGIKGQRQEGIDIYVRKLGSSKYSVWQCKQRQSFNANSIEAAVNAFLNGSWAPKTDEFVLAVTINTEDAKLASIIETQSDRLREHEIRFLPLGITQISNQLKDHPNLVDDFFGREWVRAFCGEEALNKLSGHHLRPEQVIRLRQLLRDCYTHHFEITDPGLPSFAVSPNSNLEPISLIQRFVPPDILEEQLVHQSQQTLDGPQISRSGNNQFDALENTRARSQTSTDDFSSSRRTHDVIRQVRRSAIEWLSDSNQSVLVGDPGMGKSTLLRCLLLDLLSVEPRYESFARRWGQFLPVWVPFAMWTRMVCESETKCSLLDVLKAWFAKLGVREELIHLVEQAIQDSRLLLFVDGLDEWSDETAARTALSLLENFVRMRNVPAVATSRPLGFARIGRLGDRWNVATLAGLTLPQQRILTEQWYCQHRFCF